MEKSENIKKVVIGILIILLLLGIIMMVKLVKKDDTSNNKINVNPTNTIEITDTDNITNNEIDNTETVDNEVSVEEVKELEDAYSTSSNVIYQKPSTSINNNQKEEVVTNKVADTTSPELEVKYSIKEKTNQDVTVIITSNEQLQNIDDWNLSSDGLSLTKVYPSNISEEIYVKDIAGNITTVYINIENIDKVAPKVKVEYSNIEYTSKNVEVVITSDKQLQELEGWTLTEDKKVLTREYDKNIKEEIKVKDLAGNEILIEISINNIDKENPDVSILDDTLFLSKEISIKLEVSDKISGIDFDNSYYKIDTLENLTEDYSTYNKITYEEINISENVAYDGIYYLHIVLVDKAGNKKLDTIKLTVDTLDPKVNIKYSVASWTKDGVTVTATANKAMEDIEGWIKSEDGKIFTKRYTNNIEEKVTFTDLLGRKVITTVLIDNIDNNAPLEPTLSQTIFNSKPIDNSENINISLNLNIKDFENGSGLKIGKCKYLLNQSNVKVTDFSSANTFTGENQTLHFTIKENTTNYLHILLTDNVGNATYTIHTIISDTANPIVTREYNTKDITNQNVIVTVKSSEVLQGKAGWEVYDGGLTLRKEYTENIKRTIENFYDLAGNAVGVDITITNIDKANPNEAKVNNTQFNTKTFTIKTELSDDYSGIDIAKCKYLLNSNKESDYSQATGFESATQNLNLSVEQDGLYYLHILSVDKAGNETDTIKEIKVDSTNPEGKVKYSKTDITNKDVIVTITANEKLKGISGWTLSEDKKSLTRTYSTNIDTSITITDLLGNTNIVKVKINNIDKVTPTANISYSTTTQTTEPVTVTIKANEKIVSTDGWQLSSDELTLTKTFTENTTETVTIRDLAGNYNTVSVIVANII